MSFRHALVALALVTAVVPSAAVAADEATVGRQGPLRVATFTLRAGTVRVYLPDDAAAGDTISGTVVAEPTGKSERARRANRAELEGLRFDLGSLRRWRRAPGQPPPPPPCRGCS